MDFSVPYKKIATWHSEKNSEQGIRRPGFNPHYLPYLLPTTRGHYLTSGCHNLSFEKLIINK
jgi:hypothetical protein